MTRRGPAGAPPDREPLEFVRNGTTGTVHVVASETDHVEHYQRAIDRDLLPEEPMLHLALGPVLTLCGWLARTSPAFNDHRTDCFNDDDLCRACHRALGDRAAEAFEHDTPPPSTDAHRR